MKSVFIIIFIDLIQRYTYWTQDVNWTYIRRSGDVVNAFWTSYIRSIYVLCLGRCFSFWTWACLFCLPYRYQFFIVILENSCVGIQKQAMEVFCEKKCSKNFCKFHRKTPVLQSLFNKDLKACNFIKEKLKHRCFPVKFVKFLETFVVKNICERLLLEMFNWIPRKTPATECFKLELSNIFRARVFQNTCWAAEWWKCHAEIFSET